MGPSDKTKVNLTLSNVSNTDDTESEKLLNKNYVLLSVFVFILHGVGS